MSNWIITTNTDVLRGEAEARRLQLARDWATSRRHPQSDPHPASRHWWSLRFGPWAWTASGAKHA